MKLSTHLHLLLRPKILSALPPYGYISSYQTWFLDTGTTLLLSLTSSVAHLVTYPMNTRVCFPMAKESTGSKSSKFILTYHNNINKFV